MNAIPVNEEVETSGTAVGASTCPTYLQEETPCSGRQLLNTASIK